MPSYILRNIDPSLWGRVKARSQAEQIPLRAIILALLEMYAADKVKITARITATVKASTKHNPPSRGHHD